MWPVLDTLDQLCALKVPAYYVPQARVRLLSTTSILQSYQGDTINIEAHQLTLSRVKGPRGSNSVVARVNTANNLPMTTVYSYSNVGSALKALNAIISTARFENMNLSEAQKKLVRLHNKLGHISYKRIQSLMRSAGTLAHLHTAAYKLTDLPKCAACQFGKQKQRPTPSKTSSIVRDRGGIYFVRITWLQDSVFQWTISCALQKEDCLEAEARLIRTPCTLFGFDFR